MRCWDWKRGREIRFWPNNWASAGLFWSLSQAYYSSGIITAHEALRFVEIPQLNATCSCREISKQSLQHLKRISMQTTWGFWWVRPSISEPDILFLFMFFVTNWLLTTFSNLFFTFLFCVNFWPKLFPSKHSVCNPRMCNSKMLMSHEPCCQTQLPFVLNRLQY